MLLNKGAILSAEDRNSQTVAVPEWGGDVRLMEMTAGERDRFEASLFIGKGKDRRPNLENMRAKLLALCIVDESGARLFDESDIDALSKKNARVMDRLFDVAQAMNGLSAAEVDTVGKPSATDPSAESSSE